MNAGSEQIGLCLRVSSGRATHQGVLQDVNQGGEPRRETMADSASMTLELVMRLFVRNALDRLGRPVSVQH